MKKTLLALSFIAAAVSVVSCKKLVNALFQPFSTETSFETTLPELPASDQPADLGSEETYFNLDSTIKTYTSDAFNISSVENLKAGIEELTINLNGSGEQAPDSANNLSNFETIQVSFYSDTNPTPVMYETSNADVYATSVSLPVDKTVDLLSYMKGTKFIYTIRGKLRRGTTHPLPCTMTIKYRIYN